MPSKILHSRELVAVERIERDSLLLSGGGLRKIILVSGINFELRSEEEQEAIIGGYQGFLNSLDFDLQIFIHSRKVNIASYLEELASIASRERVSALGNLVEDYRSFVGGLVAENPIMEKRFFVVVPFDPIIPTIGLGPLARITTIFRKQPAHPQQTSISDDSYISLTRRAEEVVASLTQIGLRAVILNNDELTELLYNLYNPQTVGRSVSAEEVKLR